MSRKQRDKERERQEVMREWIAPPVEKPKRGKKVKRVKR
jgi:hypothetical protein